MATTLDDLASEAGVCKMTVSLALRNKGRMASATRARIQQLAEQRGYRPNASARAVSNGRHGCVALVMSAHTHCSNLPRDLLRGIEAAVSERGSQLLFTHLDDAQLERAETMPRILREWACDGLMLNYHYGIPELLVAHVKRYAIPVVWVNADLPQDSVRHDDQMAGRLATQHLLDLGHRRIAYADLNFEVARKDGPLHYSRTNRRDGYREAMASAGLSFQEWRDGWPIRGEEAIQAVVRALISPDRPTAVVLHSQSSLALLQDAVWRSGRRVPNDLSVINVSNGDEARGWGPLWVSAVELCQKELGALAVEALWMRMDSGGRHFESRLVAPVAVPRDTSAQSPQPARKPAKRGIAVAPDACEPSSGMLRTGMRSPACR